MTPPATPPRGRAPGSAVRGGLAVLTLATALTAAEPSRANDPWCSTHRHSGGREPAGWAERCRPSNLGAAPATRRAPLGAPESTSVAWAHNIRFADTGNVVRHFLPDFPGQTVLGQQPRELTGYDWDPAGEVLYAIDRDDGASPELGTVDPVDASFSAIGPSMPLTGEAWGGLATDPVSGVLYAVASNDDSVSSLYTLDTATGAATWIGSTTVAPVIVAIAMDCSGALYAHDVVTDSIYTLDPATGAATLVGATGVDSDFGQELDFDNATGTLYAWTYQGAGLNRYGTIDLGTGLLTPLSVDTPFGQFVGAVRSFCPGTGILFADGFESGSTGAWDATVD